jgi:acetyl esterase/lipase
MAATTRPFTALRVLLVAAVGLSACAGSVTVAKRALAASVQAEPSPPGTPSSSPTSAPGTKTTAPPANIAPNSVLRDVVYSPLVGEKMDLYYPSTPGPHPVIVWMHGGGWIDGSKDLQPPPDYLTSQMARRNFVVVSIDYRLANWAIDDGTPINPFPAAVYDVKTAVRFLKARARAYDLRADMIVLTGDSAGGHLAALSATSAAEGALEPVGLTADLARVDSTVQAVVDVVGISDVKAWGANGSSWTSKPVAAFLGCPRWQEGVPDCPEDRYTAASVGTYVSASSPPAFLAYGAKDGLVPASQHGAPLSLQWAAAKGAANVVYDLAPNQGHELDGHGIDRAGLDRFVDGVLAGTIH